MMSVVQGAGEQLMTRHLAGARIARVHVVSLRNGWLSCESGASNRTILHHNLLRQA